MPKFPSLAFPRGATEESVGTAIPDTPALLTAGRTGSTWQLRQLSFLPGASVSDARENTWSSHSEWSYTEQESFIII